MAEHDVQTGGADPGPDLEKAQFAGASLSNTGGEVPSLNDEHIGSPTGFRREEKFRKLRTDVDTAPKTVLAEDSSSKTTAQETRHPMAKVQAAYEEIFE